MDEGNDEKLQIAFHCVLPFGSLARFPLDAAHQESTVHVTIRIPVKQILGLICTACQKTWRYESPRVKWLMPGPILFFSKMDYLKIIPFMAS